MQSDGFIPRQVEEKDDDEKVSMPRFKDFYKHWIAEKDGVLSSMEKDVVKIPGDKCDWYIIPMPQLKPKPKFEK